MTLPRLDAITAHWEAVPPLAISLSAIAFVLGVGRAEPKRKGTKAAPKEPDEEKTRQLFELLGGQGFATEKPKWLTT